MRTIVACLEKTTRASDGAFAGVVVESLEIAEDDQDLSDFLRVVSWVPALH
jgi:hypothetical protein